MWSEPVEHLVVQVNECLEQLGASPGVARIILCSETAFREIDADALCADLETATDVLLAFVDEVFYEFVLWIAGNVT